MQIHLSEMPKEGLDLDYEADPTMLDLSDSGVEFVTPIHFRVRLVMIDRAVYVSGEAEAQAKLQCVRCLDPVSYPMQLSFKMNVEPREPESDPLPGEWHELHPEELNEQFYSGDTLDLAELVREQILLSLPAYPLCRTDCRGLCPRCGADLNRLPCRCATDEALRPMTHFQEKLKKIIKK